MKDCANSFGNMKKVDATLFTKTHENNLLILQIYVNDINSGSINEHCARNFLKL